MRIRNDVKVGANVQQLDLLAEEGHATGAAIIAVIAIFKGKNPAQTQYPVVVTRQTQRMANDRFIEKLQPFLGAGTTRRLNTDLARFQAIQPEPDTAAQDEQRQQFQPTHCGKRKQNTAPGSLRKARLPCKPLF